MCLRYESVRVEVEIQNKLISSSFPTTLQNLLVDSAMSRPAYIQDMVPRFCFFSKTDFVMFMSSTILNRLMCRRNSRFQIMIDSKAPMFQGCPWHECLVTSCSMHIYMREGICKSRGSLPTSLLYHHFNFL
jgi:hypothetical protein